ncbi:MAG: DUF1841 family protein [Thermoflexales bacterium]|nr:DUF1841 family protein [Thermoflexales bacterium]
MEYDPLVAPDPKEWLEMDEDRRVQMVLDYHLEAGIRIPKSYLHAIIHTIVENQAALGDETPVEQTLRRLMHEGLDRHDAIHAIGSVLINYVWNLMHEGVRPTDVSDSHAAYFEEVRQLTAQEWLTEYAAEEVEPRPGARKRRRRHPRSRGTA